MWRGRPVETLVCLGDGAADEEAEWRRKAMVAQVNYHL